MELRYQALQKTQAKMLKDMETAIAKRDIIVVGARGKKQHGTGGAGTTGAGLNTTPPTTAAVKKQLKQLKKTLAKTEAETAARQADIEVADGSLASLQAAVGEAAVEHDAVEAEVNGMQEKINDLLYQKQRAADSNAMLQRLLQQYKGLEGPNAEPAPKAVKVVRELQAAEDEQQAVLGCIARVAKEFPHLAQILESVGALAKIEIPI
jgi:hypothetical protein